MEIVCKKKDLDKARIRVNKRERALVTNAKVARQVNKLLSDTKTQQVGLAGYMGIAAPTLSDKLNNKKLFSVQDLKLISDYFEAKIVIA